MTRMQSWRGKIMSTIVMTGASSGLGKVAAAGLVSNGARVITGVRGKAPRSVVSLPLDLASLASTRAFAAAVVSRLASVPIDSLVLNAGSQFANADGRTVDGFETTFAVNHLAHYLLARLLLAHLGQGATIVLTTSGTHDPAERTIVPAPRHARAEYLAHPDRDPERDENALTAAGRAYSSSKLCNVLTARALARLETVKKNNITVVAYDPGATPGTRLVRNGPLYFRLAWRAPRFLLRLAIPRLSTVGDAGRALADLAAGVQKPRDGYIYGALRGGKLIWKDPSELARNDQVMEALWRDSAQMAGVGA
jgi:NAD(P)-dependent dehydrogenase (short-subunit alcohol dehydrogenase family)